MSTLFKGIVTYKGEQEQIKTDYVKLTIVVEEDSNEQYKDSMAIEFSNQWIKYVEKIQAGDLVEVEVKTKANEYNWKYYNSLRGWRITKLDKGALEFGWWEELPF